MSKAAWITWERQLRNRSMASRLAIPLFEIQLPKSRISRYPLGFLKTAGVIWRERPKAVVAQNPSVILCVSLLLLRIVFRFRLVIDAHYGGVIAYNGNGFFQWLIDSCNRYADMVIVTNQGHADLVRGIGGTPFICPDPLPDLSEHQGINDSSTEPSGGAKKIFYISSFDVDEPLDVIIETANAFAEKGCEVYISGNYKKTGLNPEDHPAINLMGFVSEEEFYQTLFSADVCVDLTTNEDCLVCGAYESLQANVPVVLSDTPSQRHYFKDAAIYTNNQPADVIEQVMGVLADLPTHQQRIALWKSWAVDDMANTIDNLSAQLTEAGSELR